MNGHYVTRGELIELLQQWQRGALSTQQVWDWASLRYVPGATDFDDWEGDVSVANEVMSALDSLDMNLIVIDDVPMYLDFLATPIGAFAEGFQQWQQAQRLIDRVTRCGLLKEDPIYALFCQ